MTQAQEKLRTYYFNSYPILSRIEPWLRSKLKSAEFKFNLDNLWSAHEDALALSQSQKLSQTVYFLNRDLAFMKEVSKSNHKVYNKF